MNLYLGGVILISFVAIIATTIATLRRRSKASIHTSLSAFLLCAATWGLVVNLQDPQLSNDYNLWVVRGVFVAALIMVYTLYLFVCAVTAIRLRPTLYVTILLVLVLSIAVIVCTPLIIPAVTVSSDSVVLTRSIGYTVLIGLLLTCIIVSFVVLFKALRRTRNLVKRSQLQLVIVGLMIGVVLGVLTNIILPNVTGSLAPARYAWISLTAWTALLIYAVIKHRFLDIRLAAVRTAAYALSLITMVSLYFGLASVFAIIMGRSSIEPSQLIGSIIIAFLIALIFQPVKQFFDRLMDKLLFQGETSSEEFFVNLSRRLASTTIASDVLKEAAVEIVSSLRAERVVIAVATPDGTATVYDTVGKLQQEKKVLQNLITSDTQLTPDSTFVDNLSQKRALTKFMHRHGFVIVQTLQQYGVFNGYIFMGERKSGRYSTRHLRLLDAVHNELAITIQNALSIQEVKDLNATLQQRIDAATRELRTSNRKLQKLDEAKDEFVSMASHQLRTPLTSVKGYLSMVLEGDAGKITPMQRKLLSEAFSSSERMVHLIADFLNVSRLQTGRFMLERRQVDLARVTDQEVESIRPVAESRGVALHYRQPSYFPSLEIDEAKIRQVIMNFIDNAIYYSRDRGKVKVSLQSGGGFVELRVEDNGIGVPAAEQAHLFGKFFRAENARKQRPDGTGVGLFLARKVIAEHGGTMLFESVEGKGSTFGFRLPIKPSAHNDTDQLDQ